MARFAKTAEFVSAKAQTAAQGAKPRAKKSAAIDSDPSADIPAMRGLIEAIQGEDQAKIEAIAQGLNFKKLRVAHPLAWEERSLKNPLGWAAGFGGERAVRFLAAFCKIDHRDENRRTPLMSAARGGRPDNVRALLELGADPNAVDSRGWNALMCAIDPGRSLNPDSLACFRLLLPATRLGTVDRRGESTALVLAARHDSPEFFDELLPLSDLASVDFRSPTNNTILSACLSRSFFRGDEESALSRFFALRPFVSPSLWSVSRVDDRHLFSDLFSSALTFGLWRIAGWLLDNKLGLPDDLSPSVFALTVAGVSLDDKESALTLAERLIPTVDLSLARGRTQGQSFSALGFLLQRLGPEGLSLGAASANRFEWLLADAFASANPWLPEARPLWELGGPQKLPRLAARVEAEILRQAIDGSARATAPSSGGSTPSLARARRL